MPIRLGSNIPALNAGRNLNKNSADFTRRIERLSSGMRINRGADDAAGLAVSENMRAEILGMRQAVRNAEQGTNLIQLAEGSLNETSNMLRRMRELAVQSANSTITDANREGLTAEFNMLMAEIDRIALSSTYNGQILLTGFGNAVSQNTSVSTALSGFTGATLIDISGAVPGTYVFTDASNQDNQMTLSVTLDDGTVLTQSIDIGASLDRDGTRNLVATGTTFVANFDRLGVQVTLAGPGVDAEATTLKTQVADGGTGGTVIIEDQAITVAAASSLATIATQLNTSLSGMTPPGSAVYDANLNEIQIETAGHTIRDGSNVLALGDANTYIDGRLNNRTIRIEAGTGGSLQVGPRNNAANRIELSIGDMRASGPRLNLTGLSVANQESARAAMSKLDSAIQVVSQQRGSLGATQNRLQYTTFNLENAIENVSAAESAIRDADMAEEISAFTRGQILTQAATAMVAQANTLPQNALQLLNR